MLFAGRDPMRGRDRDKDTERHRGTSKMGQKQERDWERDAQEARRTHTEPWKGKGGTRGPRGRACVLRNPAAGRGPRGHPHLQLRPLGLSSLIPFSVDKA